ncbi:MAG: NACHT domain-containing protein, partial [Chloroflexi bacterium]|nr:NACHT domain-containing protein [Chloroflexota bacterium]
MDAFTADFLTNLAAELSAPVIAKVARRFQQAWQGDESEQALQHCVQAGVYGMVSRASLDEPDEAALLADIFTAFFSSGDMAAEVVKLIRKQELDVGELRFLFAEAGYDAQTLPGLNFPAAIAAFEAAFLEQAAGETILQPIIQVHQGWAQTALQKEMVALMRQMVAALGAQAGQAAGIKAGDILADNVVGGSQHIETQIIYQWGGGSAVQSGEADYLKKLIGRCNRLDLADVEERIFTDDESEVQLTDVFTTLYAARGEQVVTRDAKQSVEEALLRPYRDEMMRERRQQEEEEEKIPVTAVSAAGVLPRLVILGHPGGGKSTVVNYLATALAKQRLSSAAAPLPDWPDSPPLPVRIILRRFAAWLAETVGDDIPAAKEGLVWRYLQEKLLFDWGCTETYRHIKKALQTTGGVVFFDGLDEVPESVDDQRRTLIKQTINDFARPLDNCKIIVTCREYAYKKNDAWRLPESQFPIIDLALFSQEQIRQFTQTWYQAMGPRREWSREKQEREAKRLTDAVVAQPHLLELGQYPLLLTLMAQVHGRYGDLPENRADLYDRAVNLLLSHWENRLVRGEDGLQQIEPGLIARLNLKREDVR